MYTEKDILTNPDLIMFDETLPMNLKCLALTKRPSLINILSEKPIELLKVAFENGYWNDEIASNIEEMDENNIIGFLEKADIMYIEIFLSTKKNALGEKCSIPLISKYPQFYNSNLITKSDKLDWILLESISDFNEKIENPLLSMSELTEEKVKFMYNKFGKIGLMNVPMEFQSEDIKMDIIKQNPYDYPYIAFTKEIANFYVTDYLGLLPYIMKSSKYDPYYETRVLMILSVYGAALQFVEKQTEDMQMIAIKNNPMAIEYAIKPKESICLVAIQLDKDAVNVMSFPPKAVCKILNIPYVKPSKYDKDLKYLITMSIDNKHCYRVYKGSEVDDILNKESIYDGVKNIKTISKVKEITEEEEKILKKFGLFKTENVFFDEDEMDDFE